MIFGSSEMTILRTFELFPTELVALTVKTNVPVVVGLPEISPVAEFKSKPAGNLPMEIDQVIGVVPVAARV